MIWLGYDSKRNYLPEPEPNKAKILHWKMSSLRYLGDFKNYSEDEVKVRVARPSVLVPSKGY